MNTYLDDLVAARAQAAESMREIIERAEEDRRDLTSGENREMEYRDRLFTKYDAEIRRLRGLEQRVGPKGRELARAAHHDDKGQHMSFTRIGSEDTQTFADLFRGAAEGRTGVYTSPVTLDYSSRALQSAGGSAVETSFADFVTVYERQETPMLDPNVVRFLSASDGSPIVLPRLTADAAGGGTTTAEGGGITLSDPTISQVTLTPSKYAAINVWSAELDQDNVIGLQGLMAQTTARQLGLSIGTALTTALVTAATNAGTASGTANYGASATFFGWGDLITAYTGVASPYRSTGSWQVSSDAFTKILQMRDGQNNPVILPSFNGAPSTLLGRPIYINPALAAVGSASKSVFFGSFDRFIVHQGGGLRVELSRDFLFGTDQVALKCVQRVAGDLVDAKAVAYLISANT